MEIKSRNAKVAKRILFVRRSNSRTPITTSAHVVRRKLKSVNMKAERPTNVQIERWSIVKDCTRV